MGEPWSEIPAHRRASVLGRRRLLAAVVLVSAAIVIPVTEAGASADVTAPAAFDMVADAGDYQTGYSVASPWSSVSVSWYVTTDDTSAVSYQIALDGAVVRVANDSVTDGMLSKRIDVPDGEHEVVVTAVDAAGNRQAANQVLDVVVDKYTPTFTSNPTLAFHPGPVTLESVPVRYTWSGTDIGTGLARVHIGYTVGCCEEVSVSATHHDFNVPMQSSAAWRVFLIDGVGRTAMVPREMYVEPVPDRQLQFDGRWRKHVTQLALNGDEMVSSHAGDRVSVRVTGRSAALVAAKGPKYGKVDVLLNGRQIDTVNLASPQRHSSTIVWSHRFSRDQAQRITVINHSAKDGSVVVVDGVLVQR